MLAETARLAKERALSNVEIRDADAEALPFPDDAFDLVTCRLAFHHFPHPDTAVHEFARVLRPGGVLGFADNIAVEDATGAAFYNEYERLRDPSHHEVLPLSPNGLAILRQLALHPGEVVSRDSLLRALPGQSNDPHTAEVAVARLREALAPHPLVKTVIKRGYVLQVL